MKRALLRHQNESSMELTHCAYINMPPLPMTLQEAKGKKCYSSPVTLAHVGLHKGFKVKSCGSGPEEISTVDEWWRSRRKIEKLEFVWEGEDPFKGKGSIARGDSCGLSSDCVSGLDCIADAGLGTCLPTNIELGGSCAWDDQCRTTSGPECELPADCQAEFSLQCRDSKCKKIQSCGNNAAKVESATYSPLSRGIHRDCLQFGSHCTCCGKICPFPGRCVAKDEEKYLCETVS